MNLSVSDDYVIINIQGIRNVTWGEANSSHYISNPGKKFFITVTYKGSHNQFWYRTEEEARNIFDKIREAMDRLVIKQHLDTKKP